MKKILIVLALVGTLFANPKQIAYEAAQQGYEEAFIDLVEMIYGKTFLSQGGEAAVDQMFQGIDLTDCKVLDIGCGLGGPALYLGKNYHADITGIDPQEWMIARADNSLSQMQADLVGQVQFLVMEDPSCLSQFEDNTFDVVTSKEALLHVPISLKQAYFSEIYRVLKPNGHLVILDWARNVETFSTGTQKMMEEDGVAYNLISRLEYVNILTEHHFSSLTIEDTTADQVKLCAQDLKTIKHLRDEIIAAYGEEVYDYCLESWGYQQAAFESEEIVTVIFRARKHAL